MTTQEFFDRYDSKDNFTEDELYRLWIGDLFEDYSPAQVGEKEYDEPHRWNIPVSQVIKIEDRYFMIYCFEGLTECQESYYDTQPDEVYPVEKTITITCWEGVPPEKKIDVFAGEGEI